MDECTELVINTAILSYAAVMITLLILKKLRKRPTRSIWIKKMLALRKIEGTHVILMPKLRADKFLHVNYLRMNNQTFELLLQLIGHRIKRQDTILRRSISPSEKLALTLRYLATGK